MAFGEEVYTIDIRSTEDQGLRAPLKMPRLFIRACVASAQITDK